MKKVIIDCGSHLFEGLEAICKLHDVDNTWLAVCFEPNKHLRPHKEWFALPCEIYLYKCGVWSKNDSLTFYPQAEGTPDNIQLTGFGSAFESVNSSENGLNKQHGYQVQVSDIAEVVNKFAGDFTVLKLDIEGAEIEVLQRLIDSKTIQKVSKLYVEFHDWAGINKIEEMKEQLNSLNVNWEQWT